MYSETQLSDFSKVYFSHYFVQRHVSALVMSHLQVDNFRTKVKYTIVNARTIFSTHTTFHEYNTL
jgi:hypothetical protein